MRCAHRNGLLMSAPELATELLDACGPTEQWRDEDDDDDLGSTRPRAGTEVYDVADDEDEDDDDARAGTDVDPLDRSDGDKPARRAARRICRSPRGDRIASCRHRVRTAAEDRGRTVPGRRADVDHQHDGSSSTRARSRWSISIRRRRRHRRVELDSGAAPSSHRLPR